MQRFWLGVALAVGTGCSAKAPPPRAPAATAPAAVFDDYVWMQQSDVFAHPNATCAQSITYETTLPGYRWGEAVVVDAHTDHWIAGQARVTVGTQESSTFFSSEQRPVMRASDVGDDHRCRATAAPAGAAPVGTATAGGAAAPSGGATAHAPRAPGISITVDGSLHIDPRPPREIFRFDIQHDASGNVSLDVPPVAAGTHLRVDFWGMGAIDWGGVTLEIHTYEIIPKDPATYRKHIEAKRWAFHHPTDKGPHIAECVSKLGAPECADVRVLACQTNETTLADPACADVKKSRDDAASSGEVTNTPPPPPIAEAPPPKPSDNAVWVSGHWVYVHGSWSFWSAGFWRVSDEDRKQGRTTTAPSAPPPPRPEPARQRPPPAPGAQWTPGYWQWNGHWTWVAGAWRVPPKASATWRPFKWNVDVRGSFKLDPGGWSLP